MNTQLCTSKSNIMNYSVIKWDNDLHIVDDDAFPVYHLDRDSLQTLAKTENMTCSACIFHLASYGVLPTQVLYEVAAHIQNVFGALNIDWFTTFYYVEKNSYLTTAFRMKEMLEEKGAGYAENRLQLFSDFEENEVVPGIDAILMKIVMMNMISYNVKVR